MRCVPFHPAHLDILEPREHEAEIIDMNSFLQTVHPSTTTLVKDGRVIAIAGFYHIWNGVIEVFVLPSRYTKTCALEYFYFLRGYLKMMAADDTTLHRMQTRSIANEETDRFMKALGFTCEGTLPEYSPDKKDYKMWGRKVTHGLR